MQNKFKIEISVDAKIKPEDIKEQLKILADYKVLNVKKIPNRRSTNQNSASHLWFTQIADHCRERGLTLEQIFKKPADIPINENHIKDFFREMGMWMFKKDSTTKLNSYEFTQVVEKCKDEFADRVDYHGEFPNQEALYYRLKNRI